MRNMSLFAIDSCLQNLYNSAVPQGVSGKRSLKISKRHSAFSLGLQNCGPLPTDEQAEGYKGEKTRKMTPIRLTKTTEKGLRPLGDSTVELHFDFCFQQN